MTFSTITCRGMPLASPFHWSAYGFPQKGLKEIIIQSATHKRPQRSASKQNGLHAGPSLQRLLPDHRQASVLSPPRPRERPYQRHDDRFPPFISSSSRASRRQQLRLKSHCLETGFELVLEREIEPVAQQSQNRRFLRLE